MRSRPRSHQRISTLLCCAGIGAYAGCSHRGPDRLPTEQERIEMLSLMLPDRIEITPFTEIRSFDADDVPDGILAVIRPVDRFGDPVKAVGQFQFELWSYQLASGERRGQQLAFWDRTIVTAAEVRLYWNRARMYEFQLAWTQGPVGIAPGRKFLFVTRYRTPWDTTIEDERVLEFQQTFDLPATGG